MATATLSLSAQDSVIITDWDTDNWNTWKADEGDWIHTTEEEPGSLANFVGKYTLTDSIMDAGASWLGSRVNSIMGNDGAWGGYDLDTYPYFSIDVYSDSIMTLGLKAEDGCCGDPKIFIAEEYQDYTQTGEWQTLYFDLSSGVGLGDDVEMVVLIDLWSKGEKTFYFDNFIAYKSDQNPTASISEINGVSSNTAFPNPATDNLNIQFQLEDASNVVVEVIDILGNVVQSNNFGGLVAGTQNVTLSVDQLQTGIYSYVIKANGSNTSAMFVVK